MEKPGWFKKETTIYSFTKILIFGKNVTYAGRKQYFHDKVSFYNENIVKEYEVYNS